MTRTLVQPDLPGVKQRASDLTARGQVQYWVVLSYQDGLELLSGRVPRAIRPQLLSSIKRGKAESPEEYALRVNEATT